MAQAVTGRGAAHGMLACACNPLERSAGKLEQIIDRRGQE